MNLNDSLKNISSTLTGQTITDDECEMLKSKLENQLIPEWLLTILQSFNLTGTSFSLGEDLDLSEMGVEMKWADPVEILREKEELYPGLVAHIKGYLPVGICLEGSGDPYFLKLSGGDNPVLVRIPHDSCDGDDLDESAVEIVSEKLSDFFDSATIE
ncbi:hypothetical protein ACFL54_04190 [Planctomycetota bacterium]